MDLSTRIASDITVFSKYARYLEKEGRRETWDEIVDRYEEMLKKKYPKLKEDIVEACEFVRKKKVLPSMRALQFSGRAIERGNSRLFNCAFAAISYPQFFRELMFLLLGGSGVGYSAQNHHVRKLPTIKKPGKERRFVIGDSIEGWADSVDALFRAYFYSKPLPRFDFSDIRAKGERLKTAGGKAPGPAPLRTCLSRIQGVLENKEEGSFLEPWEVSDISCIIADAVLSGGIRRAALICLFDLDDEKMLNYKSGAWWELHPERARVNVSAVSLRSEVGREQFDKLWEATKNSGAGEPGIAWTNNKELGSNPCFHPKTKILTTEGYREIGSLDELDDLFLVDENGLAKEAKVWCSGIKKICKLTFSDREINCTSDHVFKLNDGSESKAKDLKGKRLMPLVTIREEVDDFVKLGFIQGDGGTGRLKSLFHRGFEINIGEKDKEMAELFGFEFIEGKKTYYTREYKNKLLELGFDSSSLPERILPREFLTLSFKDKCSFLMGLYSANGSVIKGSRVAFKTTCKNLVCQLKSFFDDQSVVSYITTNKEKKVVFSNGTYVCKESYDLNLCRYASIIWFAKYISFVHQYKRNSLKELILSKAPLCRSVFEDCGESVVYDFSLEGENHWGVVEGVVAHNCMEISLRHKEFCNLTTINFSTVRNQRDFNNRVWAASFLGTLQAGFTDFHYLTQGWEDNCKEEALLGLSMTGLADNPHVQVDFSKGVKVARETNDQVSHEIKINSSARITTVKPEGTASLVLGTSSGVHGRHAPYYVRRFRFNKTEPIAEYLASKLPQLVVQDLSNPEGIILELPQKSPEGSIMREEPALNLLERAKDLFLNWIKPGHQSGDNTHNVSLTVSLKDEDWGPVGDWMWDNRENYNGISVLPFDNGNYQQAPFEPCKKEQYEEMCQHLHKIDLKEVKEFGDLTDLKGEVACGGANGCEIR